jgi:enoyl-[acyl-carrier protein] reductase II
MSCKREVAQQESERLRAEVISAIQQGKMEEFIPWAGQTVGLVYKVLPAAEIVRRIITEAEEAINQAISLLKR